MSKDPILWLKLILGYLLYPFFWLLSGFGKDIGVFYIYYWWFMNPKFAGVLTAMSVHETGNFTSPVYKGGSNLFGMREAKIRPRLELGTYQGHAKYFGVNMSCFDMVCYIRYKGLQPTDSINSWVTALANAAYFTAPVMQYQQGVINGFGRYKDPRLMIGVSLALGMVAITPLIVVLFPRLANRLPRFRFVDKIKNLFRSLGGSSYKGRRFRYAK